MAAMSNTLENRLIDHLFRSISFAAPTALYVGLLTATPADDNGTFTEVSTSSTGYARVSVAPGSSNWANTQNSGTGASSGTTGTTSNIGVITFGNPIGAGWGSITGFAIYDASTAGNMLWWGTLTQAKTVNAGDAAPSFQAGALSIQIDN